MTPVALQGSRVLLRPWEDRDCASFAELNADPVAMQFFPSTLTREESDAMVGRLRAAIEANGGASGASRSRDTAPGSPD